MKHIFRFSIVSAFIVLFCSSAWAIGIGGYFNGGGGEKFWDGRFVKSSTDMFYGGGIIFEGYEGDSIAPNYRAMFGVDRMKVDSNTSRSTGMKTSALKDMYKKFSLNPSTVSSYILRTLNGNIEGQRYHFVNVYSFEVASSQNLAFWIGPEIALYYARLYAKYTDTAFTISGPLPFKFKTRYDLGGGSVGLATGLAINIHTNINLGLQGGFRYSGYTGTVKDYNETKIAHTYGWEGYGMAAIIFRLNESTKH